MGRDARLGFALIYYAGFPTDFWTSTGQQIPSEPHQFWTSVYYSFQILVTLGLGDIVPRSMTFRPHGNHESLIGFAYAHGRLVVD